MFAHTGPVCTLAWFCTPMLSTLALFCEVSSPDKNSIHPLLFSWWAGLWAWLGRPAHHVACLASPLWSLHGELAWGPSGTFHLGRNLTQRAQALLRGGNAFSKCEETKKREVVSLGFQHGKPGDPWNPGRDRWQRYPDYLVRRNLGLTVCTLRFGLCQLHYK